MMRKTGNVERISINSVDKELTWVPGTSPNFDSYWGYAYPMTHDPGYIRTDTIVRGCLKGIVTLTSGDGEAGPAASWCWADTPVKTEPMARKAATLLAGVWGGAAVQLTV